MWKTCHLHGAVKFGLFFYFYCVCVYIYLFIYLLLNRDSFLIVATELILQPAIRQSIMYSRHQLREFLYFRVTYLSITLVLPDTIYSYLHYAELVVG